MKHVLRKVFSIILNRFEIPGESCEYRSSQRVILIVMGILFSGLSILVLWFAQGAEMAYYLPVVFFAAVGLICLVVGLLGTDCAVSRIWRSARQSSN